MTEALKQVLAEEIGRQRLAREAGVEARAAAASAFAREVAAMPEIGDMTDDPDQRGALRRYAPAQ